MEYSEAIELAEVIREGYPQLRPEVLPLTNDQPPRSMWGGKEPKVMPKKPFPLTRKQLQDWLDYADHYGVGAGWTTHPTRCPLAMAYRHIYPDLCVTVGGQAVITQDQHYSLTEWQKTFVWDVDNLAGTYRVIVSPQQARTILEQVGSDE